MEDRSVDRSAPNLIVMLIDSSDKHNNDDDDNNINTLRKVVT
jgi:hypothetical protein